MPCCGRGCHEGGRHKTAKPQLLSIPQKSNMFGFNLITAQARHDKWNAGEDERARGKKKGMSRKKKKPAQRVAYKHHLHSQADKLTVGETKKVTHFRLGCYPWRGVCVCVTGSDGGGLNSNKPGQSCLTKSSHTFKPHPAQSLCLCSLLPFCVCVCLCVCLCVCMCVCLCVCVRVCVCVCVCGLMPCEALPPWLLVASFSMV